MMYISLYLYTQDEHYVRLTTDRVIDILCISDVIEIIAEPYWKFSDMYRVLVHTNTNEFPNGELLQKIAKVWDIKTDSIHTIDAMKDNKIYIQDICMIEMSLDT